MKLRINPQARAANILKEHFGKSSATELRRALIEADLWHRLVTNHYAYPIRVGDGLHMPEDTKRKALLDKWYQQGIAGDVSMGKVWLAHSEQPAADTKFNVELRIEPYEVEDKSLANIVMEADEAPVFEIISAWVRRCRIDKCPEPILKQANALLKDWMEWARTAFHDALESTTSEEMSKAEVRITDKDVGREMEHLLEEVPV